MMVFEILGGMSWLGNAAVLTFGRDAAHFKQLLEYLAILSIVLWSIVLITTLYRMFARFYYRRRHIPTKDDKSVQVG